MDIHHLICPRCNQECDGTSCRADTIFVGGDDYAPLPYIGDDSCVICGTPPGGLHHVGCGEQRCPRCGELLMAACRCERSREIHTQLRWYARDGNLDAVKLLVLDGVPVDSRDEYGRSALHEGVWQDRLEITRFLLDAGADPNECTLGRSLIGWAACRGSTDIIDLLLDRGVSLKGRVLLDAVSTNNVALVDHLLMLGANLEEPQADGSTPVMWAAGSLLPEMVEFLLARGANVHAVNNEGQTALDWAHEPEWEYSEEFVKTIAILLKWGAEPGKSSTKMPSADHTDFTD